MIYFNSKKWGKSFEALLESKQIERIDEEDQLMKLINRGETVYTDINPYANEIGGEIVLIWSKSLEELKDTIGELFENI